MNDFIDERELILSLSHTHTLPSGPLEIIRPSAFREQFLKMGFAVKLLPIDSEGRELQDVLTDRAAEACLNNENVNS